MARNELEIGELERATKRAGDSRGSSVMPQSAIDRRMIVQNGGQTVSRSGIAVTPRDMVPPGQRVVPYQPQGIAASGPLNGAQRGAMVPSGQLAGPQRGALVPIGDPTVTSRAPVSARPPIQGQAIGARVPPSFGSVMGKVASASVLPSFMATPDAEKVEGISNLNPALGGIASLTAPVREYVETPIRNATSNAMSAIGDFLMRGQRMNQPDFSNVQAGTSSRAKTVPSIGAATVPATGANEAAMREQESNVNAVAAGYQPPMVQGIAAPRPASTPASGRPFEFNGQTGYEVVHPGYTTGETRDIPAATMQAVNQGIVNRKDGGDQGFDARMIQQGIGIGRATSKDGSVSYSDQTNRYANTDFGKQQIAAGKDAEAKRMKDVIQERSDRQTAMALDGVYGQKAREQAIAQTQNAQANQIQTDAAALSLKQAQDMDAMRIELSKAMDTGDEATAKKIVAKINALSGKPAADTKDRYKIVMQKKPLGKDELEAGEQALLLDTATGVTSPIKPPDEQEQQQFMPASDFKQFMQEQGMTRDKAIEFLNKRGFTIGE